VVLSLSASRHRYGAGQDPAFTLSVVSTSASPCSFNVGARHVRLVIRAGGRQIWGSADCRVRSGSVTTELARGVPTALPLSWHRQRSSPGCRNLSRAPAGRYSAQAVDDQDRSNTVRFRLS
jgi:hypothetical protein